MFEGRTKEAKKALINTLFQNINDLCGIDFNDIEITIFETPKENWGIRGKNADELQLNYQINIYKIKYSIKNHYLTVSFQ